MSFEALSRVGPLVNPSNVLSKLMTDSSRYCYSRVPLLVPQTQKPKEADLQKLFKEAHEERIAAFQKKPEFLGLIDIEKVDSAAEKASMFVDVNSFGRNLTNATSSILKLGEGTAGTIVGTATGASAIAGGSFGVLVSLKIIRDRILKIMADIQKGNFEGVFEHGMDLAMGTSYGGVSGSMIASNAAAFAGAAGIAATAGLVISGLGLAMQTFIATRSIYGVAVNVKFRSKIDDVNYLTERVTGLTKDLNRKWDQFAFRSSEACSVRMRDYVIQKNLGVDDETLKTNAEIIIREVNKANKKQLLIHSLLITIAVLSATAFICGLIFAGPFAPLLFVVGAALWFTLDSNDVREKIGNVFGKEDFNDFVSYKDVESLNLGNEAGSEGEDPIAISSDEGSGPRKAEVA